MYRSLRKKKVVVRRSVGKQIPQRRRLKKGMVFSRKHVNSQSQAKIHIQRVRKKKLPKPETRVPSYLSKMHVMTPPVFESVGFYRVRGCRVYAESCKKYWLLPLRSAPCPFFPHQTGVITRVCWFLIHQTPK